MPPKGLESSVRYERIREVLPDGCGAGAIRPAGAKIQQDGRFGTAIPIGKDRHGTVFL
jgi:hypothetical protein